MIEAHPDFPSAILDNRRTVHVYLPPGYADGDARYPVLYMQDGQNLFDPAKAAFGVEWEAGKTADRLIGEGEVEPLIIVGIENTPQRQQEYGPNDTYGRFIVEELKPYVDGHYRTETDAEHTGIGGSSLGGFAALQICIDQPDAFGRCAAFSPSVWYGGEDFVRRFEQALPHMRHINFRVLVGKTEGGGLMREGARAIRDALRRAHHPHWRYREFANLTHDEASWARQFPIVLPELFPAN
ncbi:MAG: alpha/beta hydrolase-fold protein [Planctomycetota bacterium]